MAKLKNYVVINRPLVESLAQQLNLPIDQERTSESQFGLVGKVGIGFKKSTRQSPLPSDDPRLLAPIVEALRESGQLRVYRPESTTEFWEDASSWYVHEAAIAQPVLLPFDKTKPGADYFPEAVTVWVIGIDDIERETRASRWRAGPQVLVVQELTSFPKPQHTSPAYLQCASSGKFWPTPQLPTSRNGSISMPPREGQTSSL